MAGRPPPPPSSKTPVPVGDEDPSRVNTGVNQLVENPAILDICPPEPKSLEDAGLKMSLLGDIALKYFYYTGSATGVELAHELRLPWTGVVEAVIDFLAAEKLVDLRGGKGFGRASVDFVLSEKGREYARDALSRNTYIGPAPVPVTQYNALISAQTQEHGLVTREDLARATQHLTVSRDLIDRLGPAVNSGRSLFLYGPPGNGKTSLAEAIPMMFGGEAYIPYAIEIDNQIIKVFDELNHQRVGFVPPEMDNRWLLCRKPAVVVGGELTLETLDLLYSETARFYEAPFQVKANGGMLLIDDFGRQKVHPTDLLNRWIVPLEKRIDFLTLHTGKKFEIPFEQLLVFSTNLDPKELVDEAFLRRIRYKIEVTNPTETSYRDIFKQACEQVGVPYVDQAVTYVIDHYYKAGGRGMRACHPRDILRMIKDHARFRQVPPALSKEYLDMACRAVLIEM
jgi:predicted ATPase with chaperone activity